jgi:hypothetical protein
MIANLMSISQIPFPVPAAFKRAARLLVLAENEADPTFLRKRAAEIVEAELRARGVR